MRDEIYKDKVDISKFTFDQKVVDVFDDMVLRSVPGYRQMIEIIGLLSRVYPKNNSNIYDLGCSTGASTSAVISNLKIKKYKIYAVDNSVEMINQARKNLKDISENIVFSIANIEDSNIENASLIILNLTLQFIPIESRYKFIQKIFASLKHDGVLFYSEKIHFKDDIRQNLIENLHIKFKKENGYSQTEIYKKRKALEKVLITETIEDHTARLEMIGFKKVSVVFQCLNFVSFVAHK